MLQDWVVRQPDDCQWGLMTALRGPDMDGGEDAKEAYTFFIRLATFDTDSDQLFIADSPAYPPDPSTLEYMQSNPNYELHVIWALRVILVHHPEESIRNRALELLDALP